MGRSAIALVLIAGLVGGCAGNRPEEISYAIEKHELSGHIDYLAAKGLKGRKPGTMGSRKARKYIGQRFEQFGLEYWKGCRSYEQDFGYGTNIVGVLPGADDELKNEYVLVSAHYDHLGKVMGGYAPGACDNASGVSAMLELAERLSLGTIRPKRSIIFASFDCEEQMGMGAFAFTCRDDFSEKEIAAVINIDMLGRGLFDVFANQVCIIGTEFYPGIEKAVLDAGKKHQIWVMPMWEMAPFGDHVAFECYSMPYVFFTCGLFNGYHTPYDTAEELDVNSVCRSALTASELISKLTDEKVLDKRTKPKDGNRKELENLWHIADMISRNAKVFNLKDKDVNEIKSLMADVNEFKKGTYSRADCEYIRNKSLGCLIPVMAGYSYAVGPVDLGEMQKLFARGGPELVRLYTDFYRHFFKYRPGVFRSMPDFEGEKLSDDPNWLSIVQQGEKYELNYTSCKYRLSIKLKGLFKTPYVDLNANYERIDHVEGTKDDMLDFAALRAIRSWDRAWYETARQVEGREYSDANDLIDSRIKAHGAKDRKEWVSKLVQSENKYVSLVALLRYDEMCEEGRELAVEKMTDPGCDAMTRWCVAAWGTGENDERFLKGLVGLLDDKTKAKYPGKYDAKARVGDARRVCYEAVDEYNKMLKKWPIGKIAQWRLRQISGKDFASDKGKWQEWVISEQKSKEKSKLK